MYSKDSALAQRTSVNFDGPALVELTIEDIDYRIDSGKQGTVLSISTRPSGTWDWAFGAEVRWDGSALRSRGFSRAVLDRLSAAFKQAVADLS